MIMLEFNFQERSGNETMSMSSFSSLKNGLLRMSDHDCVFPEVVIEKGDEDENLKVGMKVLTPCVTCGETPLDDLHFMNNRCEELQAALLAVEPYRPLYHWTPSSRRKQINRYGLRPAMPSTTSTEGYKAPYVCFADSPSWAWALSGGMKWAPTGNWDLWMTYLHNIEEPIVHATPDRPTGLYEVRSIHRLYKRNLWYVGSRMKWE
jgi:hypothetical protein